MTDSNRTQAEQRVINQVAERRGREWQKNTRNSSLLRLSWLERFRNLSEGLTVASPERARISPCMASSVDEGNPPSILRCPHRLQKGLRLIISL